MEKVNYEIVKKAADKGFPALKALIEGIPPEQRNVALAIMGVVGVSVTAIKALSDIIAMKK